MRSRILAVVAIALLAAGGVGVWAAASEGASAPPGDSPLTAARFELTIDGHSVGIFSELAGISSGVDPIEVGTRRGETTATLPGKRTPPTVTLKRGLTRNLEMSAWHELVLMGDLAAARKQVVLVAYGVTGDPIARYHLENAWPAKLEIGSLQAGSSSVLTETVTLVCDHLQRVSV
jgi:phage tail-like protein